MEGVEKMMGESEEARRYQQEISEALAGQMSNEEEDEVEDELERLEREVDGVKMPDAPTRVVVGQATLPDVPGTEVEGEQERLQKQKERARQRRVALEAS